MTIILTEKRFSNYGTCVLSLHCEKNGKNNCMKSK